MAVVVYTWNSMPSDRRVDYTRHRQTENKIYFHQRPQTVLELGGRHHGINIAEFTASRTSIAQVDHLSHKSGIQARLYDPSNHTPSPTHPFIP